MNHYIYYLAVVTLAALCMAAPALIRHRALRRIEALMSDFCRAPTRAKAAHVEHLLAKYRVHRDELDSTLYARWLNVRLAMDRLNVFRSSRGVSAESCHGRDGA